MSETICPQCKNPIYDEDALSCHFCGSSLSRVSSGALGGMRSAGMKWIVLIIAVIVAAAFILTMFM